MGVPPWRAVEKGITSQPEKNPSTIHPSNLKNP